MGRGDYRRRRILIDKKTQFGMSMSIALVLACYLLLFCALSIYLPFVTLMRDDAPADELERAATLVAAFSQHIIWPLALTFMCLGLHCVLLTHRIVGPAYRFKKTFESVREHDLSAEIRLRKKDFLHDVADGFNAMMGDLRRDIGQVRDELTALTDAARDLTGRATGPVAESAGELLTRAERLSDRLDAFRLEANDGAGSPSE